MSSVPTQIRIDSKVKEQAVAILNNLGLDMSSAVNIFLRQIVLRGGLPFTVDIPNYNQEVLEALEECRRNSGDPSVPGYDNMSDLKDSLMSDKWFSLLSIQPLLKRDIVSWLKEVWTYHC